MNLMIIATTIAYILLLLLMRRTWLGIKNKRPVVSEEVDISLVVAARDEVANISALLESAIAQKYPIQSYEVIIVDDHSTDTTAEVVQAYKASSDMNLRLLRAESGHNGKKNALKTGILAAKGSVIATTDADCLLPDLWLKIISEQFSGKNSKLIFGPVAYKAMPGVFQYWQQWELAALIGTGAASWKLGMPNMCNGANMAFDKSTFFELGGYSDNEHIASGDDEFFMHKVYDRYPSQVHFIKDKDAIVETEANTTIKKLFHQRKRWAGKWRFYANKKAMLTAFMVFMINMLLVLVSLSFFFPKVSLSLWFGLLSAKYIAEALFIGQVMKFMGKPCRYGAALLLSVVYPFYAFFFGITGNFGTYEWKGRHLR